MKKPILGIKVTWLMVLLLVLRRAIEIKAATCALECSHCCNSIQIKEETLSIAEGVEVLVAKEVKSLDDIPVVTLQILTGVLSLKDILVAAEAIHEQEFMPISIFKMTLYVALRQKCLTRCQDGRPNQPFGCSCSLLKAE
jgi:hypothetical protein